MKKIALLVVLSFLCTSVYSQKKKSKAKKATTSSSVLAKADNVTAEIVKGKFYLSIEDKGKKKDTITIKSVDSKSAPKDCKITAFTAKNNPLYLITWTENATKETPDKKEEITLTYSEIYELSSKTKAFSNVQTSSKIKEKVYLDKLKNASETQDRMHNEGYTFALTKEGDVVLTTKKQSNKMSYDPTSKKYVDAKKKK